jgi:hypothetical protein
LGLTPSKVLELPEKEDEFLTFAIMKRYEHGNDPTEH